MLRQREHKAGVHEVTTHVQILPILVEISVHHNY